MPAEDTPAEVSGQPWKPKQRRKNGTQHLWDKEAQPKDHCKSTVTVNNSMWQEAPEPSSIIQVAIGMPASCSSAWHATRSAELHHGGQASRALRPGYTDQ